MGRIIPLWQRHYTTYPHIATHSFQRISHTFPRKHLPHFLWNRRDKTRSITSQHPLPVPVNPNPLLPAVACACQIRSSRDAPAATATHLHNLVWASPLWSHLLIWISVAVYRFIRLCFVLRTSVLGSYVGIRQLCVADSSIMCSGEPTSQT
jgi:hypothetical protein